MEFPFLKKSKVNQVEERHEELEERMDKSWEKFYCNFESFFNGEGESSPIDLHRGYEMIDFGENVQGGEHLCRLAQYQQYGHRTLDKILQIERDVVSYMTMQPSQPRLVERRAQQSKVISETPTEEDLEVLVLECQSDADMEIVNFLGHLYSWRENLYNYLREQYQLENGAGSKQETREEMASENKDVAATLREQFFLGRAKEFSRIRNRVRHRVPNYSLSITEGEANGFKIKFDSQRWQCLPRYLQETYTHFVDATTHIFCLVRQDYGIGF